MMNPNTGDCIMQKDPKVSCDEIIKHHSPAAALTKEEYLIGFTNKISLISANEAL